MVETTRSKDDLGQAEMQKAADEAEKKGFIGVEVDPTPNERYSQESSDWRTPETDPAMAAKVGSAKFTNAAASDAAPADTKEGRR